MSMFLTLIVVGLPAEIVELNTIFGPEDLSYYIERNQKFYDQTGVRVNITLCRTIASRTSNS